MSTIWDRGLDELAAKTHAVFGLRMIVTASVASLVAMIISWEACVGWAAIAMTLETLIWIGSRRQNRGEPVGAIQRWGHLILTFSAPLVWVGLGALLWASGSAEGAVCAVIVWLTTIYIAQMNVYPTPALTITASALPGATVLGVVLLAPNPLGVSLAPVLCLLAYALLSAGGGLARIMDARKRFEETQSLLRERDRQYRVLASNVTDVIALTTLEGRPEYVSPSIEGLLGYTLEDVTSGAVSWIHPDDVAVLRAAIDALAVRGGQYTTEYRLVHKDGRAIWVETCFTVAEAEVPGAPRQIVSVSRTIERRKQMEHDLIEARESAEAAAAAKSDFLANMTHELRTPLNAIVGFSGLLNASADLGPEEARHARLIGDASATLLELVNTVLDFSRLEAGAVALEAAAFDPLTEVEAQVDLLAEQAAAKGLILRVDAEGALKPLLGDAGRIRQVVVNFLSNALKFTTEGEVTVKVRQAPAGAGRRRLRVQVIDTGIGVPRQQIDRLFERFTQADVSVSRRYGGTGLGLAICKRTIELMDGKLGAESVEGRGSTFWFELVLPVAKDYAKAAAAPIQQVVLERPIRLLLVEDVAVNRELVQTLLRPFEVDIVMAENGIEAIEAVERDSFDVILMDVQMPVMDGLTAARRIRELPDPRIQVTPIIAMTANVLPEQVRKCLQAGMDDHLGKPISPALLLRALSGWAASGRSPHVQPALRDAG